MSGDSERALTFRQTFGLRDDAVYVASAAADPTFSAEHYGVPLSPHEEAELQRRVQLEKDSRPAAAYGAKQATWGGYRFDQLAGGAPVFMFTDYIANHEEAIRALLPRGTDFRIELVAHTLAQLERLQEDVTAAIPDYRAQGVRITNVAIDLLGNQVTIGVNRLEAGGAIALVQKFGPGVAIHDEAPAQADACPVSDCRPIKGGIRMVGADGFRGTAGFIVRRGSNSKLSVLTAGHVIWVQNPATGGLNLTFYHDTATGANDVFGLGKYQTFHDMSEGDVGLVQIDDNEAPATANRLFLSNSPTSSGSVYTVTDTVEDWNQTLGSQACAYGQESNNASCATVTQYSANHESCADPNPGAEVCNIIRYTKGYGYNLIPGDSGGPIYQIATSTNRYALGTHVSSVEGNTVPNNDLGWYTPHVWGEIAYNRTVAAGGHGTDGYYICTNAACS